MPCAYLYVHNFPRTRVSRFGRKNLAFDKETALDGQGPFDSAALRSHRFRSASLRAGRAGSGTEGLRDGGGAGAWGRLASPDRQGGVGAERKNDEQGTLNRRTGKAREKGTEGLRRVRAARGARSGRLSWHPCRRGGRFTRAGGRPCRDRTPALWPLWGSKSRSYSGSPVYDTWRRSG